MLFEAATARRAGPSVTMPSGPLDPPAGAVAGSVLGFFEAVGTMLPSGKAYAAHHDVHMNGHLALTVFPPQHSLGKLANY
jgi:hypothetical protein